MKIINKNYVFEHKKEIIKEIISGKIFIYPTDTIYGIGCNAIKTISVKKIKDIKKRRDKPFSVIAPSKDWIKENCKVNEKIKFWLKKLPGPRTLVLDLRNKKAISKETNNDYNTIGVRIPNHWFCEILKEAGVPFITTSVNIASEEYMINIKNLEKEIARKVDYAVDDGILNKNPSTVINLVGENENILR